MSLVPRLGEPGTGNDMTGFRVDSGEVEEDTCMVAEKTRLSLMDLDAQTAIELPNRDLALVTIVITNLLNNLSIDVDVKNNNVAVQVCAVIQALNVGAGTELTCDIEQRQ